MEETVENGGSIILRVEPNMTTLLDFSYNRKFIAKDGGKGEGSKCYGKDGEDLIIDVPMGTVVRDLETDKIMCDLSHAGDTYVVLSRRKRR